MHWRTLDWIFFRHLGELLLAQGRITEAQLEAAQHQDAGRLNRMWIGEALRAAGLISSGDLAAYWEGLLASAALLEKGALSLTQFELALRLQVRSGLQLGHLIVHRLQACTPERYLQALRQQRILQAVDAAHSEFIRVPATSGEAWDCLTAAGSRQPVAA